MFKSKIIGWLYKNVMRPILFKSDPEKVHVRFIRLGRQLGKHRLTKKIVKTTFNYENTCLEQTINEIKFNKPVGLAAGFDYEANLAHILPDLGFGFGTMGTITNMSYEGNPRPMLKRLIKSKALIVNKGFKNPGAEFITKKLDKEKYDIPIGISIGRTNSPKLKTLGQSISDIAQAFQEFEKSNIANSYYEMNISCPNLIHGSKDLNFYEPKRLRMLLKELDQLKLSKPLFMKMPITLDETSLNDLIKEVLRNDINTIILGNLESNRNNPAIKEKIPSSVKGNISGKPTFEVSNRLIRNTYKTYGKDINIVGCGGVFSAEDAYIKIKLGASLIQLITGMIYEGPQLIGQINRGLTDLLKRDGYTSLKEAVGADIK